MADVDLDLTEPLAPLPRASPDGRRYVRVLLLVRLRGRPVGLVTLPLPPEGLPPSELATRIRAVLDVEPLEPDGTPPDGSTARRHRGEDISVVVPTCRRAQSLRECLDSLLAADHVPLELLVVDNRPDDPQTRELLASQYGREKRVRYLAQPRRGAAAARNLGLRVARGEVVAFVDDDVVVDRRWLGAIAEGFAADGGVHCVTGLIVPRELETPAQVLIERYGGFGKGCQRQLFDLRLHRKPHPLYPYTVGSYGSGANMAFSRRTLTALGGFDLALGPGTPTQGGEDIDALLRVVLAGHTLVYEPAAVVWHRHRRDDADLRRLLRAYGTGLGALLVKHALADPASAAALVRRVPSGVAHLARARCSQEGTGSSYPPDLIVRELLGLSIAPLAYLQSLRQLRRAR